VRTFLRRSLTILSLLCFVAVVVLWVRSRWSADALYLCSSRPDGALGWMNVSIGSMGNTFLASSDSVTNSVYPGKPTSPSGGTALSPEFLVFSRRRAQRDAEFPGRRWWNRLGFCCVQNIERDDRWVHSSFSVGVPHWFLVPLFAAMPLLGLRRIWTRRRRIRAGLCADCGYDLRASRERCPECGAARQLAPAHG
jgi:hypothetical protein